MWRALFLAVGIYGCILGGECLVIDKAVLNKQAPSTSNVPLLSSFQQPRSASSCRPTGRPGA